MAHLGERAFDTIGGAVVSTTAFVCQNIRNEDYAGTFIRAVAGRNEAEKREALLAVASENHARILPYLAEELVVFL